MNPLQLALLGVAAGAGAGLLIVMGSALFVPLARALRAGLAGMIGGAVGFAMTALVQGPFYSGAKDFAALAEPMGISALVALGAAGLAAAMILREGR